MFLIFVEKLAVEISDKFNNFILVGIYRPPSSNITRSLAELGLILEKLSNLNKCFVLAGDININYLNRKDHNTKKYMELLDKFHVTQKV